MLLSVGCKPTKEIEKTKTASRDSIYRKDSVVIKEVIKYSPVDSAAIKASVNCPDVKPIKSKSKTATASFEIKNGVAKVTCLCDSAAIRLQEKEFYEREYKEHLKSDETLIKQTVEVPYYPLWMKILAGIGVAAIIYTIFRVINYLK